jgi:hypothetical protein
MQEENDVIILDCPDFDLFIAIADIENKIDQGVQLTAEETKTWKEYHK